MYIVKCHDLYFYQHLEKTILKHPQIAFSREVLPMRPQDKFVPLCEYDLKMYCYHPNMAFSNDLDTYSLLGNKSRLAALMMRDYPDHFPKCYYYSYESPSGDTVTYFDNDENDNSPKIERPNLLSGGRGIKIVDVIQPKPETIVTKYIDHKVFYVGHYLIKDGVVLEEVYFKSAEISEKHYIKRGGITDYTVQDTVDGAQLFHEIFKQVNFTGLANIDFILDDDGKIVVFEIDPRLGFSLIVNETYMNRFIRRVLREFC